MNAGFLEFRPGERIARGALPLLSEAEFRAETLRRCAAGERLADFFGMPGGNGPQLIAILANDATGRLAAAAMAPGREYAALTPELTQAHLFEREIFESWGVRPVGHPALAPVRYPTRPLNAPSPRSESERPVPGTGVLYRVEGEGIHEVAVGPVHAGIIEPGHFRFQCLGEEVLHLEIALGYQHRGIERALLGGPHPRTLRQIETAAGDTSIGHATAYARVLEALAGVAAPPRAGLWRAIALELERLANHTGDLGALAQDVGFLPTSAYCGRIRGEFLNATALLCGNRFGRGWVAPGGVAWDGEGARVEELARRVAEAGRDVIGATDLLWETPTVMARFEDTGRLTPEQAVELGLVGVAARACGLPRDARRSFPVAGVPRPCLATWPSGDVLARAKVRRLEIEHSLACIAELLKALPEGAVRAEMGAPAPDSIAVALVEGWRGEICHTAVTDAQGRFAAYRIVDPSFHNWSGLAWALRGQAISDFPLCNKSFNLSYCGFDL